MLAGTFAIKGIVLGLSAAASPGPFQAYLIAQALRLGWKRALPIALAPLLSDGPIILLVLFVLTRLPQDFLRWLQVAGGLFVLYLALKSFQAYRVFQPESVLDNRSERLSLIQAVMMNFLSPGPYIYWSILAGPLLLSGWNDRPAYGIAFLAGFYVVMVSSLVLLIILFGSARRLGPRVNRILLGISALALFGFGLYQLWQAVFPSAGTTM